ncbi:DUF1871 family protein [Cytobacillus gottheilii]
MSRLQSQEMNLRLVDTLNSWDPFQIGAGSYDTEIADILQAVHDLNDAEQLSRKIQAIFEFSFEEVLPLKHCYTMAVQLLSIKNDSSCSI